MVLLGNWQFTLTKEDIKKGVFILRKEKINPLSRSNLFKGALWCFLSSTERYDKQLRIYSSFINRSLDTPERILNNWVEAWKLIKKTRFPNQRLARFKRLLEFWQNSELPHDICCDTMNGKQEEFTLRNELARNAPGFGLKCSSLLLIKCGYENIVPIDLWMIRYLRNLGYNIEEPDYKRVSGLTDKHYLFYEEIIREISEGHGISPALFQAAIWGKNSMFSQNPLTECQLTLEDFGGGFID
ncbi:MAG: hypothetical protein HXS54_01170 [Theionarchaea archaeon]|nr:hypothetical protein [Theionarchaea archaeon]